MVREHLMLALNSAYSAVEALHAETEAKPGDASVVEAYVAAYNVYTAVHVALNTLDKANPPHGAARSPRAPTLGCIPSRS